MTSAYPSSYSFFDATSDSITAVDVGKRCRDSNSPSISFLADLFKNSNSKSDLFPKARAPVCVPDEVCFPTKKKRDCEEKTSIWHEWGSGECQTENVAQESSGMFSELVKSSSSKVSESSSPNSPLNSFPNLGSANVSLVAEEFDFPARKTREEQSSWREENAMWQEWRTTAEPSKEIRFSSITPSPASISIEIRRKPMSESLVSSGLSSNSSVLLTEPGARTDGAVETSPFSPRKNREESRLGQDCNTEVASPDCRKNTTSRGSSFGVGALADLYTHKQPGAKCSGLFSQGTVGNSGEVDFPKRKNRADRNVWRDWTNTGYDDFVNEANQEISEAAENSARSAAAVPPTIPGDGGQVLECSQVVARPAVPLRDAHPAGKRGELSVKNICEAAGSSLRASVLHEAHDETLSSVSIGDTTCRADPEAVSSLSHGAAGNVDALGPSEDSVLDADGGRTSGSGEFERTMDGGEFSDTGQDAAVEPDDDAEMMSRFRGAGSRQRSFRQSGKYPPPLGSLLRQGSPKLPDHMPWVQLQRIRTEGRFMLQEGKVTQPVVFQPTRKDGRLVLHLIGQDSAIRDDGEMRICSGSSRPGTPVTDDEKEALVPQERVGLPPGMEAEQRKAETMLSKEPRNLVFPRREKRKKSAKVWPEFAPPPKSEAVESLAAGSKIATGLWNRKPVNSNVCSWKSESVSIDDSKSQEPEKVVVREESCDTRDSLPPWLLTKIVSGDVAQTFEFRGWLQSDKGLRDRFPLSSAEAPEHYGQRERAGEYGSSRAQLRSLPRTQSLLSGLTSGLGVTDTKFKGNLSIPDSEVALPGTRESMSSRHFSHLRGASDAKHPLSVYPEIFRNTLLNLATVPFVLCAVGGRPELEGEPDPTRLFNCASIGGQAFSCADVMGKGHHEKSYWEQSPCVS